MDLCRNNPELSGSVIKTTQNELRVSNNSAVRAIASDYKGAAGGRQRVTIFDELWAYDLERMTRLFEEMRPPPTEPGSYIFIVSYAGFAGESTVLEKLYHRGINAKRISKRYEIHADSGLCMFGRTQRACHGTKKYFQNELADLRPNQFLRLHKNQ